MAFCSTAVIRYQNNVTDLPEIVNWRSDAYVGSVTLYCIFATVFGKFAKTPPECLAPAPHTPNSEAASAIAFVGRRRGPGVMRMFWLIFACVIFLSVDGHGDAQGAVINPQPRLSPPAGLWLVEDGSAIIEFSACGNELCGAIFWARDLKSVPPEDARDKANPDRQLRDRPICGLRIISGLKMEAENYWAGGTVYNPDDGLTYGAEMHLEPGDKIRFRGFIALPLLGGSQIWSRPSEVPVQCQMPAERRRSASLTNGLTQTPE